MFGIETPRLIIRTWKAADRDDFVRITSDPEVTRYVHHGEPYTDEEVDGFFERQALQLSETGVCMGALVEKESDRVIGIAGTQPLGTTGHLEIGWILEQACWGRGYATEAGAAAMAYVLETLARPRVVAIIHPDNEPSKRVAARLGMRHDARYTGAQLGHRLPEIEVDLYFRER